MEKQLLLVKTDLGRRALTQRSSELSPKLRFMLILVDGKRSASELDQLGAGLGGGLPLLEQLLAHGWIIERDLDIPFLESVPFVDSHPYSAIAVTLAGADFSPSKPPATTFTKVSAKASTTPASLEFASVRRLVVRFVNEQLGPLGEMAAIQIESCKTFAELQVQLPKVRNAMKSSRGAATLQRFDVEIGSLLPQL